MLAQIYFWLFDWVTSGVFAKSFGRFYGLRRARWQGYQIPFIKKEIQLSTLWFHAASVGELEMLMPILERALENGRYCGLSVFSDSALPWIEKLKQHPRAAQFVYLALSPRERDWSQYWQDLKVEQVWVAKYDFWPGMWIAAEELQIRVRVVNAQARSSWTRLKSGMQKMGFLAPRFNFYCLNQTDKSVFQSLFPDSTSQITFDPRRVQIRTRVESRSSNSLMVIAMIQALPKPVGIIGSAWQNDLDVILKMRGLDLPGSIVVFPHSFEPTSIQRVRESLKAVEQQFAVKTQLVLEKGVLVECYPEADWVWVGGGFGQGVHSTLEPAFAGRPIFAGKKNSQNFDEIADLCKLGQLTLGQDAADASAWFKTLQLRPGYSRAATPPVLDFPTQAVFWAWVDPLLSNRYSS